MSDMEQRVADAIAAAFGPPRYVDFGKSSLYAEADLAALQHWLTTALAADGLTITTTEQAAIGAWLDEHSDRRWEMAYSPKSKPALRWVVKDDYGNVGHGPTFAAAVQDMLDPDGAALGDDR